MGDSLSYLDDLLNGTYKWGPNGSNVLLYERKEILASTSLYYEVVVTK